jgi:AbrB family looped-hinge helix DNA binding protein
MKDALVPIDQAGRIVLPKNVRQELAIQPGDVFKVSIAGAAVTLTPNREKAGLVRKGRALVFSVTGDDVLTLEQANEVAETVREESGHRAHGSLVAPKRSR